MTPATDRHDLEVARIESLLRRLDPAPSEPCTVPGCQHLDHGAHADGGALPQAA